MDLSAYYNLGLTPGTDLDSVIHKYLLLMGDIEKKIEFEISGKDPKIIDKFTIFQTAIETILKEEEERTDSLPPNILKKFYYYRGKKNFIKKRYFEAGKDFQEALRLDRKNPKFHYFLGRTFLQAKRYKFAKESFVKALKHDNRNPYFWTYLGDVYEIVGSKIKAQNVWHTSLSIDRNFEPAKNRLRERGVKIKSKLLKQKIQEILEIIFEKKDD